MVSFKPSGGVAEWLNAPVLKTGVRSRGPWVQIPPPPHETTSCIVVLLQERMKGFLEFIREQGVAGLAIGFILGGAVSKLVASIVDDIINPLIGGLLLRPDTLAEAAIRVGDAEILWGSLIVAAIDFTIIALVVYYGVKIIGVDRLDKEKGK